MSVSMEQFKGALVGLAVGDALGYPTEFISREQILQRFGPQGLTDFAASHGHPPGTYTDDTQMSLAVAEGLLAAPSDDLDDLMEAIARQFVIWMKSPDNDRAPGNTCMAGCRSLQRGVPWREAGVAHSKGCGSAMRVSPVGLLFHDDLDRLVEVARATALPTHGHPAAQEGAAAAALMAALAARGAGPQEMYDEIKARCFGRSPDFDACLSRVPDMLGAPPAEALAAGGLGEAWIAEEAVASALYCVWRHPDDYGAAVLEAINTDGDSDSIGAITGSVMGARLGIGAIPEGWVEGVEGSAALQALASRLRERHQKRDMMSIAHREGTS